jgi:hypothetical protein
MKIFIPVIITLLITQGCVGQVTSPSKEFYNYDFKWTITIPENFQNVSSEDWSKMQNRGKDAIEGTYDIEVENHTKTIFIFKSDQFNYFESLWQPYDVDVDGDYLEAFKGVNEIIYGTFKDQMPNAKIDTSSSIEVIDNLTFYKFRAQIFMPNQMVLSLLMYSRLFDKKEFTVNIMYVNNDKGEKMINAWINSKFGK